MDSMNSCAIQRMNTLEQQRMERMVRDEEVNSIMLQRLDSIQEKIGRISQSQSGSQSEAQSQRSSLSVNGLPINDKVIISSAADGQCKLKGNAKKYKDSKSSFIGHVESTALCSPTRRSSLTMRKSIYQIAEHRSPKKKAKKRCKMSIARASIFRRCEPAIALSGDTGALGAEQEAVRRAKSIAYSLQHSRKSVFFNFWRGLEDDPSWTG